MIGPDEVVAKTPIFKDQSTMEDELKLYENIFYES